MQNTKKKLQKKSKNPIPKPIDESSTNPLNNNVAQPDEKESFEFLFAQIGELISQNSAQWSPGGQQLAEYFEKAKQIREEEKLIKENNEELIAELENAKYYEAAKEVIEALKPSVGYVVELTFDPDTNKLLRVNKISIRSTSKQKRHVTPIALIKRIIQNVLVVGATPEDILKNLQNIIEIFKPNVTEENNNFIQLIFTYFKHPKKLADTNSISKLIKIIAHLYHKNLYLIMDDKYVEIPAKTNDCFLVPKLSLNPEVYKHNNEGSFIRALVKNLDDFHRKCLESADSIDTKKLKQISYIIFALFDFMPLPKNAQNSQAKANSNYHRYVGEDLHRLYHVTTNHLQYFFEAYPFFKIHHYHEIMDEFLSYTTYGVSIEKLYTIFDLDEYTNTKESQKCTRLMRKLAINRNSLLQCINLDATDNNDQKKLRELFPNLKLSYTYNHLGFHTQYKKAPKEFLISLKIHVSSLLISRDHSYMDDDMFKSAYQTTSILDESLVLRSQVRNSIITILYGLYSSTIQGVKNFINLPTNYEKVLPINKHQFHQDFYKAFLQDLFNCKLFSKKALIHIAAFEKENSIETIIKGPDKYLNGLFTKIEQNIVDKKQLKYLIKKHIQNVCMHIVLPDDKEQLSAQLLKLIELASTLDLSWTSQETDDSKDLSYSPSTSDFEASEGELDQSFSLLMNENVNQTLSVSPIPKKNSVTYGKK